MIDRLQPHERFSRGPVMRVIKTEDFELYQKSAFENGANLTIVGGSGEEVSLQKPGTAIDLVKFHVPEDSFLAVVVPSEGHTLRDFWIAVDGARAVTSQQETF